MGRASPTVRRRRLAAAVRRLRREAGKTREEVADYVGCAPVTISRIENAQSGARVGDVARMLELFGVDGQEKESLLQVARQARQRGWWQRYTSALPEWFTVYVGLEAEAATIRGYDIDIVPGLLQTEDYMRALLGASLDPVAADELERRVAVRMQRQAEALDGDTPSHVWQIISEAALHRPVGTSKVHRAQLDHLCEQSHRPNVTLQVLPYDAGTFVPGAFTILGFTDPHDPDIVYVEYQTGALYLEEPEELATYVPVFDHLRAAALSPTRSRTQVHTTATTIR